ncbi:ABC transporter substrate-binding protein [Microaceticoccus formicicus]|uniref:ABC transporter substrate-binding protein n=1 Tax=Microaceticoccus formicicus TaxID=3118105 RepID=UPI003CD00D53|nr:ABC transporter substrate-binding protein [Peptoniphilaceae bacterium AMB_02]
MNKKSILALLLALVMLLSACGGTKTENKTEGDKSGAPSTDGKVLTTLYDKQGEGTNFDTPWWNRGDLYKVISFRSLFKANSDLSEFNPDLIQDYKMADDGLSYEFNLKDGLKWSDGKELTGEDVKFSIEGALKGAKINGIYTAAFTKIEGAKEFKEGSETEVKGIVVDGNNVTIKLTQSVGNMVGILSQFAILPKHGFEGVDMTEYHTAEFWKKPVTNGMYKVDEVVTDSYLTLVPNENYEGTKPKIEKVVVNIVPSDAKLNAVLGNKADFFNTKVPAEISSISKNENWQSQAVDTLFYYYLVFNYTGNDTRPANEYIKNPKFREAMYYAIDRENFAKNLFPELAEVSTFGVPGRDSANNNGDLEKYAYNPEKAKEILKEINYKDDKPLEFRYYMADQSSVDLYNSIAQNLKDVGISVNVQKFAGDATQELFDIRNYDFALKGLSAFGYDEWYGEYASTHGNFPKLIGDAGKQYDELYNELLQVTDPAKKAEILKGLQEIESKDLSKMTIFMLKNMIFTNSDKVDTKGAKFGNPWFATDIGFENWELK